MVATTTRFKLNPTLNVPFFPRTQSFILHPSFVWISPLTKFCVVFLLRLPCIVINFPQFTPTHTLKRINERCGLRKLLVRPCTSSHPVFKNILVPLVFCPPNPQLPKSCLFELNLIFPTDQQLKTLNILLVSFSSPSEYRGAPMHEKGRYFCD
jgi:hypothetical protein